MSIYFVLFLICFQIHFPFSFPPLSFFVSFSQLLFLLQGFPGSSMVKNPSAMHETQVRSLGWEDSPGERNGNPLQYSCLENPMNQRTLMGYSPWSRKRVRYNLALNSNSKFSQDLPQLSFSFFSRVTEFLS